MTFRFVSNSMLKPQRVAEYDNELQDLQRRWRALNAGDQAVDRRQLIIDTKYLEQRSGMQPGQLLNKLRETSG